MPFQKDWRFCGKCHQLFFDGYPNKGVCKAGGGHEAMGYDFYMAYDIPGSSNYQRDWRFCGKCHAMFFDGYPDKGECPAGNGHQAIGYNFALLHDAPSMMSPSQPTPTPAPAPTPTYSPRIDVSLDYVTFSDARNLTISGSGFRRFEHIVITITQTVDSQSSVGSINIQADSRGNFKTSQGIYCVFGRYTVFEVRARGTVSGNSNSAGTSC